MASPNQNTLSVPGQRKPSPLPKKFDDQGYAIVDKDNNKTMKKRRNSQNSSGSSKSDKNPLTGAEAVKEDIADTDWMYTKQGYMFQLFLLLLLVSGDGLKHQYASFAVKETTVLPQSLTIAGNLMTVLIALAISMYCLGPMPGFKKCMSISEMYRNSFMAASFSIGQSCHILQLCFISAAMGKIVVQSKLPFLVIGSQVWLGRKHNGKQYLTVTVLTAAITLFVLLKSADNSKKESSMLLGGIVISMVGSIFACIGTLLNEKQMKEDFSTPFYVQRFHQGCCEMFFNIILLFALPPFVGWLIDAMNIDMSTNLAKDGNLATYKIRTILYKDPDASLPKFFDKLDAISEKGKKGVLAGLNESLEKDAGGNYLSYAERKENPTFVEIAEMAAAAKKASEEALKSPFSQKKHLASENDISNFIAFSGVSDRIHKEQKKNKDGEVIVDNDLFKFRGVYTKQENTNIFCKRIDPKLLDSRNYFYKILTKQTLNAACFINYQTSNWKLVAGDGGEGFAAENPTKEELKNKPKKQREFEQETLTVVQRREEETEDLASIDDFNAKRLTEGYKLNIENMKDFVTIMTESESYPLRNQQYTPGALGFTEGQWNVKDVLVMKGKYAPGFKYPHEKASHTICDSRICSNAEIDKFEYILNGAPFLKREDIMHGSHDGYERGFFAGWGLTVWFTIFCFSWYYTVSAFVVKRLNAVWRHVAGSLTTLILFYTQDLYYLQDPEKSRPNLVNVTLCAVCLVGNIFMYLILKQEAKKSKSDAKAESGDVDDGASDACTEVSIDGSTRVVSICDAASIPGGGQWDRMSGRGSRANSMNIDGRYSHRSGNSRRMRGGSNLNTVEGQPLLSNSGAFHQNFDSRINSVHSDNRSIVPIERIPIVNASRESPRDEGGLYPTVSGEKVQDII